MKIQRYESKYSFLYIFGVGFFKSRQPMQSNDGFQVKPWYLFD